MIITNKLQAIAQCAGTDDTRPALQQIQVKDGKAYATNGYILAIDECDGDDGLYPSNMIIKHKIKTMSPATIDIVDGVVTKTTVGSTQSMPTYGGNYPNVNLVTADDEDDNYYSFGLGLDALEPLVKLMKKNKQRHVKIHCNKDSSKPMKAENGDIKLIIMPVKIN